MKKLILIILIIFNLFKCSLLNSPTSGTETPNFVKGNIIDENNNPISSQEVNIKRISFINDSFTTINEKVNTNEEGEFYLEKKEIPTILVVKKDSLGVIKAILKYNDNELLKLKPKIKAIIGRVINDTTDTNIFVSIPGYSNWQKVKNKIYTINNVYPGLYPLVFKKNNIYNLLWINIIESADTVYIKDVNFINNQQISPSIYTLWNNISTNIYNILPIEYAPNSTPQWDMGKNFDYVSYINLGYIPIQSYKLSSMAKPNAIGYGKFTTGGRGSKIYVVTNLNDDNNPGSFRYGIETSNAGIIAFDVSGEIQLTAPLTIKNRKNLTILGQTSPNGITLSNFGLVITNSENIIISSIKIRPKESYSGDGISILSSKKIYIDHCNINFTRDEAIGITNNSDSITIAYSLLSHGLYHPIDSSSRKHSVAMLIDAKHISIINNSFAHYRTMILLNKSSNFVEIINNIFYNFSTHIFDLESDKFINIINNYIIKSNATIDTTYSSIFYIATQTGNTYFSTNKYFSNNNFYDFTKEQLAIYPFLIDYPNIMAENTPQFNSLNEILTNCGDYLHYDNYDSLIIANIKNNKVLGNSITYAQDYNISPPTGIIDKSSDIGILINSNNTKMKVDNDLDGIDDNWELNNGLNPNDNNDAALINTQGISYIEQYAFELENK